MLSDQLRKAIEGVRGTLFALAIDSGISYPVLFRFVSGERDLRLATAEKLAEYLGMELTPPTRKAARPVPKRKPGKRGGRPKAAVRAKPAGKTKRVKVKKAKGKRR